MPQAIDGMKNQVIVQKAHRYGYDHAMFLCGARVTEVVTHGRLQARLRCGQRHHDQLLQCRGRRGWHRRHRADRPRRMAAGRARAQHSLPPRCGGRYAPISNLWKYTGMGFDLVAFSGGKGMRGPQNAGLLLGKKELTDLAASKQQSGRWRRPRHEGGEGADRGHGGGGRLGALAHAKSPCRATTRSASI